MNENDDKYDPTESAQFFQSHFVNESRPLYRIFRHNQLQIYNQQQNAILPWDITHQKPFIDKSPAKLSEPSMGQTKVLRNFRRRIDVSRKQIKRKYQEVKLSQQTITNNFLEFKVNRPSRSINNSKIQTSIVDSSQEVSSLTPLSRNRAQSCFKSLNRNRESCKKSPKIQFLQRKFKIKYSPISSKISNHSNHIKGSSHQRIHFWTIEGMSQQQRSRLNSSLAVKLGKSQDLYSQIRQGTTLSIRRQRFYE